MKVESCCYGDDAVGVDWQVFRTLQNSRLQVSISLFANLWYELGFE